MPTGHVKKGMEYDGKGHGSVDHRTGAFCTAEFFHKCSRNGKSSMLPHSEGIKPLTSCHLGKWCHALMTIFLRYLEKTVQCGW